jgi:ABC-type glycerol-3-phosphate transport system substrate-binding protein
MIKGRMGKAISIICAGALAFAMSGYAISANAAPKKVTIKVWDPGLMGHLVDGVMDTKNSFIFKAKTAYEKLNPHVTINISEIDGGVSDTQFRAASIAKNGPDIKIGFAGGNTLSFAAFLEPLDKYFTKAELALIKGTGTVRAGYDPKGPLLAMPYGAGSYFYIFYDKKVLADSGIDMTNPPKTWEAFISLAKKLKAAGVANPIYETNLEGYTGAWVIASLAGGLLGPNAFFDMYTGKTKIDSPEMRKAYEGYQSLYTSGVTNTDATTVGQGDRLGGFLAGKGAMVIDGGWDNDPIFKAMGTNVGTFAIPQLAGSKYPKILAGGTNVAVSVTKYSKNKVEAIKFVKYLMQAKTIDLYVKTTQTEPSNHVKADASVIVNPLLKAQAKDVAKNPQVYPFDNLMPGPTIDLFYKLNASVALGQTTPADAVKQLQASLDENRP